MGRRESSLFSVFQRFKKKYSGKTPFFFQIIAYSSEEGVKGKWISGTVDFRCCDVRYMMNIFQHEVKIFFTTTILFLKCQ